jgi:hypothetical protein
MYNWTGDSAPPDFDQELADTYVGKYILVGVTYFDHFGKEVEQLQMHGVIESASRDGVKIALRGTRQGESWVMPPMLESISAANPGSYRLRTTGEVIEDPDLLATWSVAKPAEH